MLQQLTYAGFHPAQTFLGGGSFTWAKVLDFVLMVHLLYLVMIYHLMFINFL